MGVWFVSVLSFILWERCCLSEDGCADGDTNGLW